MLYQDRLKTNLLKLFTNTEKSERFSVIYFITFEVDIVAEQKQAHIGNDFLVFDKYPLPLTILPLPALMLLRRPCR